jgi:hypothetical protein
MIRENHMKDHRKAEAIYETLRMSVFLIVRENIKNLFKTEVNCEHCRTSVELPKTTNINTQINYCNLSEQ